MNKWIGSKTSLIVHTILFIVCFLLIAFGKNADRVMLVLTTAVSLEAIYLSIFIQMTVNKNTEDIEDIAEDVEDITEDVEEIQEDVEEIQEDVEDIQESAEEDIETPKQVNDKRIAHDLEILSKIEQSLTELKKDIELLKK